MDNLKCLKTFTEDIVRKQNDSLESLNSLCRKANAVSSDISNLMNSLQMVGNRQFAENRIQEESSIDTTTNTSGTSAKNSSLSSSSASAITTTAPGAMLQQASLQSKLSSILLEAFQYLPQDSDWHSQGSYEAPKEDEVEDIGKEAREDGEEQFNNSGSVIDDEGHKDGKAEEEVEEEEMVINDTGIRKPEAARVEVVKELEKVYSCNNKPQSQQQQQQKQEDDNGYVVEPAHGTIEAKHEAQVVSVPVVAPASASPPKPIDRDRVADILKRYSLYNEDDDDDEDEQSE